MALIKIYSKPDKQEQLINIAKAVKLICSAALNCPEVPTKPSQIEIVTATGLDLAGIDFILEVVACERPNLSSIGDNIISGLNAVYHDILFSIYFNIIKTEGMSSTPRQQSDDSPISIKEAIDLLKQAI